MLDFSFLDYAIVGVAGFVVGVINGVVGGASVIVYTVLLAIGLNPVSAVVTNGWGVMPANMMALRAYNGNLKVLYRDNWKLVWLSILGTVIGAIALLNMPMATLEKAVPILLLIAGLSVLIPVKPDAAEISDGKEQAAIFGTGLYCGYFGPGQGVMVAATLARDHRRNPAHLNALKNFITGFTSLVSNFIFLASGQIYWGPVLLLAITSGYGGLIGGRRAGQMSPKVYRAALLSVAGFASIWFFIKFY